MNILMISRCPPYPLHLGDRLIIYHLARELNAVGVTLDLLAFAESAADHSLSQQQPYTGYFRHVQLIDATPRPAPELARRALIPAARFPTAAPGAFSPQMWEMIAAHVAANDYDAVHLFGGIQVYEFHEPLAGLPTVITPYESYSLYTQRLLAQTATLRDRLSARFMHMAAQHFERWMFEPYDAVTVVSEPDAAELQRLDPSIDVRVIPNGVALSRFIHLRREPRPNHIMFLGNYEYAPNLDAALWLATEILPRVRAQIPEAHLQLVGNAPPPELTALTSAHIEVTGRVPDVRPYYANAAVFVCPLRFGAGIKNKVLEALAMGCPVVATPLSIEGIRVSDGESVLLAQLADDLAAQVVRLLTDNTIAGQLGKAGRRVVAQSYSWQSVAARYQQLYTEVARAAP